MYFIFKKIIYHILCVFIFFSIIFSAFPQNQKPQRHIDKPTEASEGIPNQIAINNNVTAYGLLQFNANTNDSTRSNTPDFAANRMRLGVNVKGGVVEGRIELQFNGNNVKEKSDLVAIRKAELNLKVLNIQYGNINYLTSLSLGGLRVGGAMSTAPDIANIPNKFARQDGIYLEEIIEIKNTGKIGLGVGVFSHITALKQQPVSSGSANWLGSKRASINSNWMQNSFSNSRGYLTKLDTIYYFSENQKLNFIAIYGMQDDAPNEQSDTGTLIKVNDLNHGEASLWYNDVNIFGDKGLLSDNGIALWYEREDVGKKRNAIAVGGGQFHYDGSTNYDDSQMFQLLGLSVSGDTQRYLTDFLQKKDRFTYAVSYSIETVNFGNPVTETGSANPNYKTNQFSASVGYAVNTFETAFNIAYSVSDEKVFTDRFGNLNKNDALKGYLTAFYKF